MQHGSQPAAVWVWLAIAAVAPGCADPVAQRAESRPVAVELVVVEQGLYEPTATYRVVNRSGRALAYQGYTDGVPVSRLAVHSEGKWIERRPAWLECATGEGTYTLEPGAEATLEVRSPRPDLPVRIGIGTWEPVDGDPPPWTEWTWTWSRGEVVDETMSR